jgi:hypothetical protein
MAQERQKYMKHIEYLEGTISSIKTNMNRWIIELNTANEQI